MTVALSQASDTPHACIDVSDRPRSSRKGGINCVIGRNIVLDSRVLSEYCFKSLTPRIEDLLVIAGSVWFADKILRRRHQVGWRRDFDIVVPVHDPDFWEQSQVSRSLQSTLATLTGDTWHFRFRQRRHSSLDLAPPTLELGHGRVSVMPFSDGLDSFAAARLVSASDQHTLILVTTGRKKDADRGERIRQLLGRRVRLAMPFRVTHSGVDAEFREFSFRSRAFAFGVIAAIAAHMSGATRVFLPESGQGTFGPWLLPIGAESPEIHSHPIFVARLASLVNRVLETNVSFEHPWCWTTKGRTLAQLREQDLATDWSKTHSCSRRSYFVAVDGERRHCGVCAACLLRRQSLLRAGLDERNDRYLWRDLSASSLSEAADPPARKTTKDDERHAAGGVAALAQLSNLAAAPDIDDRLAGPAFELSQVIGESPVAVAHRLKGLLRAHRDEWLEFVARRGRRSFVARWADMVAH